jgi:hypothetical protein
VDCDPIPNCLVAIGGSLVINPTDDSVCDVPVEETSWGQIKSFYKYLRAGNKNSILLAYEDMKRIPRSQPVEILPLVFKG